MFPKRPDSKLKRAVDKAVRELDDWPVASDEYKVLLDRISMLHEMQMKEKPASVSADTLALITANLVGIMLILRHEQFNNIATKASNFVMRVR